MYSFILRIASRIAATGDSEPLKQANRKSLIEQLRKTRDVRDPKAAQKIVREVDEMFAKDQAPEGFEFPFNLKILQYIEDVPEEIFQGQNPKQRKAFVTWLGGALDSNRPPRESDLGIVADFYVVQNHNINELGNTFQEALRAANAFNERKMQQAGATFTPTTGLDEFELVDEVDGYRMYRFDRNSRPGPKATETFLKEVGQFGGVCIGDRYGKDIAKGSKRAFIIFDPRGNPVAFTDNDSESGELNQIKGKKNSKISDPTLARVVLTLFLRNFNWDQIKDTESGWAKIAAVVMDLDGLNISAAKKSQLDAFLHSPGLKSPKTVKDFVMSLAKNRFANFSADDFRDANISSKFRAEGDDDDAAILIDYLPVKDLEALYAIREDLSNFLYFNIMNSSVVVSRLRDKILKYPVDKSTVSAAKEAAKQNPVLKSLLDRIWKAYDPTGFHRLVEETFIGDSDSSHEKHLLESRASEILNMLDGMNERGLTFDLESFPVPISIISNVPGSLRRLLKCVKPDKRKMVIETCLSFKQVPIKEIYEALESDDKMALSDFPWAVINRFKYIDPTSNGQKDLEMLCDMVGGNQLKNMLIRHISRYGIVDPEQIGLMLRFFCAHMGFSEEEKLQFLLDLKLPDKEQGKIVETIVMNPGGKYSDPDSIKYIKYELDGNSASTDEWDF